MLVENGITLIKCLDQIGYTKILLKWIVQSDTCLLDTLAEGALSMHSNANNLSLKSSLNTHQVVHSPNHG